MPTYEYECRSCGHLFEKFQPITARPQGKCPECQGSAQRRMGVGAGVIFKGSGFYETDYKRKPAAEASPCSSCKEAKACPNATGGGKQGGKNES
jgi:putative FmdB family regulatory protein